MKRAHFRVTGMSCSACSARVDRCVRALPGVQAVEVNLLTGSMVAEFDEARQSGDSIIAAVEAAGYGAALQEKSLPPDTRKDSRPLLRRFLLSLVFLVPLSVLHHIAHGFRGICMQALLLMPILWLNRRFFISGVRALLQKAPNMDTLIALGAAAGILYSIADVCLFRCGVVYLESAGMILTLITFGKWLEARATGHTGAALEKLRELLPDKATLLREGRQIPVNADEVAPGDILLVRPGDRIPVDGEVQEGVSAIDESALTGESLPADKHPGSPVYAGTVNGYGALRMLALRGRRDSALSDIITMVGEAAAAKAPIARLADRISGIFVPLVVLAAFLTALVWIVCGSTLSFALGCAIAVLVISCPCALGLATPVAIMVGAGKGAELGIIFRSGAVMENARNTTAVILDKTGTITSGFPTVTDIIPLSASRDELLCTAASLEFGSRHPLAEAILREAEGLDIPSLEQHTYLPGLGVTGRIGSTACAAGNAELMRQLNIPADETQATHAADEGKTPLYIARNGRLLGIIAVADAAAEKIFTVLDKVPEVEDAPDAVELDVNVRASNYMYPPIRINGEQYGCGNRLSAEEAAAAGVAWDTIRFSDEEFRQRAENMKNLVMNTPDGCPMEEGEGVRCRAGTTSFWMTWDGRMLPCGMMTEPVVRPLEVGFDAAWQQLREATAAIRTPKECTGCAYKEVCGVCAAVCYTETGRFDGQPTYICRKTRETVRCTAQTLAEREKR